MSKYAYLTCETCKNKLTSGGVKTSSDLKYFIDINKAVAALTDDATLIFYSNYKLKNYVVINYRCTIDLNGYRIIGNTFSFINKATIINDNVLSGGYIEIYKNSASADVEIKVSKTTEVSLEVGWGKVKMYGGKLVGLKTLNKVTIRDLLPEEYVYVLYDEVVSKTLTYAETNVQAIDGNFDYIDIVPCKHNDFDVDYKCVYCNKTLTTNEAIQILLDELQIAKQELQDAIDNKANVTTINAKISSLEKAIDD